MQQINQLYDEFLASSGACTDTRKVDAGNIFFALKGPSFNGNTFAGQALTQGARAVVIDEDVALPKSAVVFRVDDVLQTLQDLARHHRTELRSTLFIGLTGSNGKTTAKELFKSVIATEKSVSATEGNLNNHIGVPLTILDIPKNTDVAIVEMGANHQKEIEFLSGISLPDIGYITNFGKAHLEGFGGVEGVIKGKSELYQRLRETNSIALVNTFDPIQVEKSTGIKQITFGKENSQYPMTFSMQNAPAEIEFQGKPFTSNLTGSFHTGNIGAAVALGMYLGISESNIANGLASYVPKNNRSQWQETASNKVMLDAYNANPSSMKASIESFLQSTSGERLLILGDMFELGETSQSEHQEIVNLLADVSNAETWLVGAHFGNTSIPNGNFHPFNTTEECLEKVKSSQIKNKSILLKGSRGMRLETIFPYL